jgi:hypothetical protein
LPCGAHVLLHAAASLGTLLAIYAIAAISRIKPTNSMPTTNEADILGKADCFSIELLPRS